MFNKFKKHFFPPSRFTIPEVVPKVVQTAEDQRREAVIAACKLLTEVAYNASKDGGWHNNPETGLLRTAEESDAAFPTRIALLHSELSEALEAHRTDANDDKLPHRLGAEVEISDLILRAFDLAGCHRFDIGGALVEKMEYNKTRQDHTLEARSKKGGKKY